MFIYFRVCSKCCPNQEILYGNDMTLGLSHACTEHESVTVSKNECESTMYVHRLD